MEWRWLHVTEDMGVVEGIPCSICERPVKDWIWFPSDFEDAADIQHLLNLWLSDPNLDKNWLIHTNAFTSADHDARPVRCNDWLSRLSCGREYVLPSVENRRFRTERGSGPSVM